MTPTILLADEDPLACERLETSLAGESFRVVQATSFDAALRLADELFPEFIFYDLNISALPPEEACRRLRALPSLRQCVLILTGARERSAVCIDPFSAPVDDFISKPYPQAGLAGRLSGNLLRRREMHAEPPSEKDPALPYVEIAGPLRSVLGEITRFKRLQRCSVALIRPEEQSAYVLASSDSPQVSGLRLDLERYPELQEVMRTGEPLLITNVAHSQVMAGVRPRLAGQPFTAMLVVPLLAGTKIIGAVVFRSASEAAFVEEEIFFCRLVAMMFTQTLQNGTVQGGTAQKARLAEESLEQRLIALSRDNMRLQNELGARLNFLQAAAQKLRAPATAIHGFCSLALESDVPDNLSSEQKDYLDKAIDCSERLVRMMTDVIDLARLQSGDVALDFQPRALELVVRSACDDFVDRDREARTSLYLAPGTAAQIRFDVELIRRVMNTLLSNAAQFCAPGGEVSVRLQSSRNEIVVHVDDDGGGTSWGRPEKFFEEFDSQNDSCGLDCAGGVGLTLCRNIIQAHGGRIWASRQGRGGRLSFSLPL